MLLTRLVQTYPLFCFAIKIQDLNFVHAQFIESLIYVILNCVVMLLTRLVQTYPLFCFAIKIQDLNFVHAQFIESLIYVILNSVVMLLTRLVQTYPLFCFAIKIQASYRDQWKANAILSLPSLMMELIPATVLSLPSTRTRIKHIYSNAVSMLSIIFILQIICEWIFHCMHLHI